MLLSLVSKLRSSISSALINSVQEQRKPLQLTPTEQRRKT